MVAPSAGLVITSAGLAITTSVSVTLSVWLLPPVTVKVMDVPAVVLVGVPERTPADESDRPWRLPEAIQE